MKPSPSTNSIPSHQPFRIKKNPLHRKIPSNKKKEKCQVANGHTDIMKIDADGNYFIKKANPIWEKDIKQKWHEKSFFKRAFAFSFHGTASIVCFPRMNERKKTRERISLHVSISFTCGEEKMLDKKTSTCGDGITLRPRKKNYIWKLCIGKIIIFDHPPFSYSKFSVWCEDVL